MIRQVLDCGDGVCAIAALLGAFARVGVAVQATAKAVTPQTPAPQSKTLTRCIYPIQNTDNLWRH